MLIEFLLWARQDLCIFCTVILTNLHSTTVLEAPLLSLF